MGNLEQELLDHNRSAVDHGSLCGYGTILLGSLFLT